jgi:hypothetical protein
MKIARLIQESKTHSLNEIINFKENLIEVFTIVRLKGGFSSKQRKLVMMLYHPT